MATIDEVDKRIAHHERERQEEWDHTRYNDPNNWELRSGSSKRKSKGQQWGDIQWGDCQQKLGFGEYADWSYGKVIMYKAGYAKYLLSGEDDMKCLAKKKFAWWIQRDEVCITGMFRKRIDGWKNIPTVGAEFEFLIISRNHETKPLRARFPLSDIICS